MSTAQSFNTPQLEFAAQSWLRLQAARSNEYVYKEVTIVEKLARSQCHGGWLRNHDKRHRGELIVEW
jgi:hypothetical protein